MTKKTRSDDYVGILEKNFDSVKKHMLQYYQKTELVKALEDILDKEQIFEGKDNLELADIACGLADIPYFLSQKYAFKSCDCIDLSEKMIAEAKRIHQEGGLDICNYEVHDCYSIPGENKYDVIFFWKILLALAEYKEIVKKLYTLTKEGGYTIISSLFNDKDVDLEIKARDHALDMGQDDFFYYNIYSVKEFTKYCQEIGFKKVTFYDFDIGIDLPDTFEGMGTYTVKMADEKRMQISSGIWMNWKIVVLQK